VTEILPAFPDPEVLLAITPLLVIDKDPAAMVMLPAFPLVPTSVLLKMPVDTTPELVIGAPEPLIISWPAMVMVISPPFPAAAGTRHQVWLLGTCICLLTVITVLGCLYGLYKLTGQGLRLVQIQLLVLVGVIVLVTWEHGLAPSTRLLPGH